MHKISRAHRYFKFRHFVRNTYLSGPIPSLWDLESSPLFRKPGNCFLRICKPWDNLGVFFFLYPPLKFRGPMVEEWAFGWVGKSWAVNWSFLYSVYFCLCHGNKKSITSSTVCLLDQFFHKAPGLASHLTIIVITLTGRTATNGCNKYFHHRFICWVFSWLINKPVSLLNVKINVKNVYCNIPDPKVML